MATAGKGSTPHKRQELLRSHVIEAVYASVDDLARKFGVSVMTVHRDLDALEADGWLVKVRGGARAHPSALVDTTIQARRQQMVREKEALAARAVDAVQPGQVVLLDESTTALTLAPLLADRAPLTVVTNSVSVLGVLGGKPDVEVIATGGTYHETYDAFLGLVACEAIAELHGDVAFVSTTAITTGSCYHKSQDTVQLKRAIMRAASTRVLLVDHSKFERRAPHKFASLADFDRVLIDDGLDQDRVAQLRDQGVEPVLASTNSTAA